MDKNKLDSYINRPKRKEFLVYGKPEILQPEIDEMVETLKSGWIGTGPRVQRFQEAFKEYTGAEHVLAVNSCTAALHLALVALGIGPGDEVITSPMTFAATANVITHVGATPVFADIDRETLNIDPAEIERVITPRTKAIIPIHFAGRACDMDAINAIASAHNVAVIEDAAHAAGTIYHGKHAGTLGDIAAFSFYATKNVVTGDGGMVTTNDADLAEQIRVLSLHGLSKDAWKRYSSSGFQHYDVVFPGYKYNMTDMEAALGIHQLERLEENIARREEIWARYDEAFQDLPVDIPAPAEPDTRHARHLYTLLIDIDAVEITRDDVLNALQAENIGTGVHYRALHLQPFYQELLGHEPEDFPNTLHVSDRTISIPISTLLTDEDIEDVIAALYRILSSARPRLGISTVR
ncbi:MAG: DegT/DnrJ/EryC1/StrS family aminotransferase [Anaerolineae bacterium]|nr:DegT/DnrJ/EryC1/StrS family aminotransferase [Anaerolineae bacterium]